MERFKDIKRKYDISLEQLAEASGLHKTDVFLLDCGAIIDVEKAEKILQAFSRLTGKTYTFANMPNNIKNHKHI